MFFTKGMSFSCSFVVVIAAAVYFPIPVTTSVLVSSAVPSQGCMGRNKTKQETHCNFVSCSEYSGNN